MTHNSAHAELFPAHYNHLLLDWRRRELKLSKRAISRLLRFHHSVVTDIFRGLSTNKTVFPVALYMGLDWAKVHDLNLAEEDYPSAVLNGSLQGSHLIAPQEAVSNST